MDGLGSNIVESLLFGGFDGLTTQSHWQTSGNIKPFLVAACWRCNEVGTNGKRSAWDQDTFFLSLWNGGLSDSSCLKLIRPGCLWCWRWQQWRPEAFQYVKKKVFQCTQETLIPKVSPATYTYIYQVCLHKGNLSKPSFERFQRSKKTDT